MEEIKLLKEKINECESLLKYLKNELEKAELAEFNKVVKGE